MLLVLIDERGGGAHHPGLRNGATVYVLCASRSEHFTVIVRLVTLQLIISTLSHGLDCMAEACVRVCVRACLCVNAYAELKVLAGVKAAVME